MPLPSCIGPPTSFVPLPQAWAAAASHAPAALSGFEQAYEALAIISLRMFFVYTCINVDITRVMDKRFT